MNDRRLKASHNFMRRHEGANLFRTFHCAEPGVQCMSVTGLMNRRWVRGGERSGPVLAGHVDVEEDGEDRGLYRPERATGRAIWLRAEVRVSTRRHGCRRREGCQWHPICEAVARAMPCAPVDRTHSA